MGIRDDGRLRWMRRDQPTGGESAPSMAIPRMIIVFLLFDVALAFVAAANPVSLYLGFVIAPLIVASEGLVLTVSAGVLRARHSRTSNRGAVSR